jgi:hypothetical protein
MLICFLEVAFLDVVVSIGDDNSQIVFFFLDFNLNSQKSLIIRDIERETHSLAADSNFSLEHFVDIMVEI